MPRMWLHRVPDLDGQNRLWIKSADRTPWSQPFPPHHLMTVDWYAHSSFALLGYFWVMMAAKWLKHCAQLITSGTSWHDAPLPNVGWEAIPSAVLLCRSASTNIRLPPGRRSLPAPPGRHSLPAPPGRHSIPAPPGRRSLPAPPGRRSMPAPPGRHSLPAPPGCRRAFVSPSM